MKVLARIIMLPVAVLVVAFAMNNRAAVSVDLWPLDTVIEVPVFALVLISGIAGLALGGMVSWTSAAGRRRRARAAGRDLAAARREAARLREKLDRYEDDAEWREKTGRPMLSAPPSAHADQARR